MVTMGLTVYFNAVLWLYFGTVPSASASMSFVTEPVDQVVAVGQSVILNCDATDSNGRSLGINWKWNSSWILDPNQPPWKQLRNNSLHCQAITAQDSGQFICAATVFGTREVIYSRTAKVQLAFTDAQFSSSPDNSTSRVRDASTYFTCVTGNSLPSAAVYWEKDGQKITTGTVRNMLIDSGKAGIKWTSSTLLIYNIDLSSAGFYHCVAVNTLDGAIVRKSGAAYLNVLPRINKPHFQVHPTNLVAAEGRPAMLQCLILGVPKPQVNWTFSGQLITGSPTRQILSNGSLYFSVVNRTFAGQYACRGSNSVGSVESSPVLFGVAFFDFQFVEHPTSQNVTMGTQVTLHCKPPNSYPVNTRINWFKNYQLIQAGPGISMISSGSLVFSAIKKSDKGEYFCNGFNPDLRQSRTSNVALITVWVPPTFVLRPQDTAVIQYQPLLVHCKSTGFPTPSLTWLKDNKSPDTSHVDILANGSLSINRTTVKDAGEYSCVASNIAGSADVKANVVIYVPPSITVYPADATCVRGRPITFKCNFTGIPQPRVEWYHHNGTTVRPVPSTPNYNRVGYTLTVTSVSVSDEGRFDCKGINVAGEVNGSAHLNVQVPVSLDAGPVNITVNQSSLASFQCIASGDPKPNITWYKEGTLLQSDGHFIITGDTLSIPTANPNDAGQYQCHVTNGLATHVGKAHLIVQVSPVINSFNVPTFARLGGNTSMSCQSSGIPRPLVTWYRDGSVIVPGSRVFQSDDGTLRIVGLGASDGAVYRCAASNAAGTTARKGNLTVQVPPSPPTSLKATPLSSTSIKLSWQPGFNGHSTITGYKVDQKREGESSFIELEASINRLELHVGSLEPYTRYTFRVLARNAVGLGRATQVSNRTLEDAPSVPNNIVLTTVNATTVRVRWSAPSHPNGVITCYEITYQSLPSGSTVKQEVGGLSLSLVLSGLRPFTEYSVRVRAATGRVLKKWGNYSMAVVKKTAETVPDEPPRDVQCISLNSTAVFVSWKPVPIGSANGDVREYRISYKATGPYLYTGIVILTADERDRNITIKRLFPWTNYNISVQAVTVGVGPGSEWKTVRTGEAAPTGPPSISVTVINETSILLNVTPPYPHKRNGHITGYTVYYKNSASSDPFSELSTSSPTLLVGNLTVFTEYDIKAAAATRAGTGTPSEIKTVKTAEGVPNAVEDIRVVRTTHDVIEVTWAPPKPETGIIIDYTLYFNTTSGLATKPAAKPSFILSGLSHNTTYHIWVVARTMKGDGPMGTILNVRTGHLPYSTGGPTTTPQANITTPMIVKASEQRGDAFLSLNQRDFIIIVACASALLLILIIIILVLVCVRSKKKLGFSDSTKTRKVGRGMDVHELRGVSPDRRPVLDVQEETSSFDEFSDWNSSITGVNSEQVTDPAPVNVSPILEFPEDTEPKPAEEPVTTPSPSPPSQEIEPDTLASPVVPSYESFKNSPVSRIRNKKLSLGSDASFYDQPYSSVDELGTGFSSFTPPPPPDFRNDKPLSDDSPSSAKPPQEFSSKLYDAVHEPEEPIVSSGDFSEPRYAEPEVKVHKPDAEVKGIKKSEPEGDGYAEPEVKVRKPDTEVGIKKSEPEGDGYAEPEVKVRKPDAEVKGIKKSEPEGDGYAEPETVSPPPPYFPSDYVGVENQGYDTDEEIDKYLGEQEDEREKNDQKPTSAPHSPSVSPLSQGSADTVNPELLYAKPDLSKKKKNRKSPGNESKDHDAVVVYDERTNL